MRDYGPTNAQRRLRLILWTKIQTINSLVYPLLSLAIPGSLVQGHHANPADGTSND